MTIDDEKLEAWLRGAARLEQAPASAVRAAISLFAARPSASASALERLVALLRFDSEAGLAPAFGVRGAGPSSRQLLFTAAGCDIDLRVRRASDGFAWDLDGQVLGREPFGEVELRTGATVLSAALNDLGEFDLRGVAPGRYLVTVALQGVVISLPPLELSA